MKALFLSLASLLTASVAQAQLTPADETAIRRAVDRLNANFNDHQFTRDMPGYCTADINWVNLKGMWWRGQADVVRAHQQIFDMIYPGVKFTPGPAVVRGLTPEVAVVNAMYHVGSFFPPDGVDRGTNRQGDNDNLMTLVFVKNKGRWLLSAAQNTIVDAQSQVHNPIK